MNKDKARLLITGASGMLGTALIDILSNQFQIYATSRRVGYEKKGVIWKVINLEDIDCLSAWVKSVKPDIFIHCAALTNLDVCETELEQAKLLHVTVPKTVLEDLSSWNGHCIYISTDAVFDGTKPTPYTEEDRIAPTNVYGQTKADGEKVIMSYLNGLVLRTNIFGFNFFSNRNFFAESIINGLIKKERLTLFTDVIYSPIHVEHLANYIFSFINKKSTGLLNAAGSNVLSKYEFGIKLSEIFGLPSNNIVPCTLKDVPLKAVRPKNLSLSVEKLITLNIEPYNVTDGIKLLKEQYDNGWLEKIKSEKIELET